MSITVDRESEPTKPPPWRRLWIMLFVVLTLVVVGFGIAMYRKMSGVAKMNAVMAELDRADPGWRWNGIQSSRPTIPSTSNSAVQVLLARSLMPTPWNDDTISETLNHLPPECILNDAQVAVLERELAKASAAILEARKITSMPSGSSPRRENANPLDLLLDNVHETRTVVQLLGYDAIRSAQSRELDQAIQSIHAAVNVSRSIGNEPTIIAQLVRIACRGIPIRRLERALAQGTASDDTLAQLQNAIETDEREPLFLYGVRGERAFHERVYHAMQTDPASLPAHFSKKELLDAASTSKYKLGPIDFEPFLEQGLIGQFADLLRVCTEIVDIARLPLEDQHLSLVALEARMPNESRLVRNSAPALTNLHNAFRRSHAEARCAYAAPAVERYRLANGKWPESLNDLVTAKLLTKVPNDPYTKDPLKLRRVADGVVIYGVGPDGKDDGGTLFRGGGMLTTGHDVGFKLWDVDRRRQPAGVLNADEKPE